MIGKVLHSKALYNRSLQEIPLKPFDLAETQQYLGKKFSKAAALDALLLLGGIPEYLRYLKRESSIYLSFCKNAFLPGAFFLDEPRRLFVSSLAKNANYLPIVELMGREGVVSREQILAKLKISSGSNVTRIIQDLEWSGLINSLCSFNSTNHSKLVRYELADPYLRIFYRFIAKRVKQINMGAYQADFTRPLPLRDLAQALGYSFEHYCRTHSHIIAKTLGFSGVEYDVGPLLSREIKSGVQLDLVFSRADKVLTVCELKYHNQPVDIKYAKEFQHKLAGLRLKPRQKLETVLIAPGGVTDRVRNAGIFDQIIGLEGLS